MAYWHYERLSALDTLFLALEDPRVHMHVGAVATFEAGPLRGEDGALDIDRITTAIEASLATSPRFRQKLESIPLFRHPVWVDDERFNLSYHVRHTSLPRPGDVRLLKRLAGRVLSQKLDLGKPLWELWVVEGLEHDRFALIVKAHHCMVDGISGIGLLTGLMRFDPDPTVEPPRRWFPRPPPTPTRLLADEVSRRVAFPLSLLRGAVGALREPRRIVADLQEGVLSFGEVLRGGLEPASPTPLNPDIGPHRRFDWTCMDVSAVKEIRSRFGGTLNDVVLATAAGAIGRFLRGRGLRTEGIVFRAQVPVNIRTPADGSDAGNRVVMLMADLPIDVQDPMQRLAQVVRTTQRLKRSRQRAGVELLEEFSNRTLTSIFVFFAKLATWQRPFNVVVTNVPGPGRPVYLLGARMLEIVPLVPLAWNQALGIALFSYDGRLYWGLNADWEALPDLHDLVLALDLEFERLRKRVSEVSAPGPADTPP
jgi:WS/DGAT/MGAT family acyltransferase